MNGANLSVGFDDDGVAADARRLVVETVDEERVVERLVPVEGAPDSGRTDGVPVPENDVVGLGRRRLANDPI